ncbi:MAG: TIGR03808 family TAT-translocated repetitive protein [Hyphomicrobiales bacterium]
MDRRKFLTFASTASMGLSAALIPQTSQAATASNHSLNAADLGLIANSSTDQSSAFQAAVYAASAKQLPLFVPAGSYIIADINLPKNTHIIGVNAQTTFIQTHDLPIFYINQADHINIEYINFEGNLIANEQSQIISINNSKNFTIQHCRLFNGNGNGIEMQACNGQISNSQFHNIAQAAIFSRDGKNLKIIGNEIFDIGNNAILIWQQNKAEDGTIISQNHIHGINSFAGGSGQNGNGVNIFRANNVIVTDNRFDDCFYSAVRVNAGDNCQIINNNCTDIGEVALYAEFGFNGVIINNNLVDSAGAGISITNLNQDGHLAICKGNLLRNLTITPRPTQPNDPRNYGISAEGDALIEGNLVENASNFGIGGGYGEFQRNISVVNNMLKDCVYGIVTSVANNAGKMTISNNSINNAERGAIVGFAWDDPATDDLINDNQKFDEGSHANLSISNNVLT